MTVIDWLSFLAAGLFLVESLGCVVVIVVAAVREEEPDDI